MSKINIYGLNDIVFCEYKFYMEHVEKIKYLPTEKQKDGKKQHKILEGKTKEKIKSKIQVNSISEALNISKQKNIVLIAPESFFLESENYSLKGRPDRLEFYPDKIIIIDYKPNKPFKSDKVQIWGYCLILEENSNLPIYIKIVDEYSNKTLEETIFDQKSKKEVLKELEKAHKIMKKVINPKPTRNLNKCKNCQLKSHCPKSLI